MPYAIMGFIILLGIGGYYFGENRYDAGFDVADKAAKERLLITQTDEARKRSELTERAAQARAQFMRANDYAQSEKEILSGRIIDLHIAGLSFNASPADESCGTGEDTDSRVEGSTTSRIRLPEPYAGNLLGMTKDAQLVVIQYNELREIVKNIPCVKIVPNIEPIDPDPPS